MFLTSYQTTVGRITSTDRIEYALKEALITNSLADVNGDGKLFAVVETTPVTRTIPAFAHPIFVEHRKETVCVIDLRAYSSRIIRPGAEKVYPTEGPVAMSIRRAELEMYWNAEGPNDLFTFSTIPLSVYSAWVSRALAPRLGLEPLDQMILQLYAAYFYCCQFYSSENFGQRERETIMVRINRATRISLEDIQRYLGNLPYVGDLTAFAKLFEDHSLSPNFAMVNRGLIMTVLLNAWSGTSDAKAIVSVAIEFPPTFIAMITAAMFERMSKRATLVSIAMEYNRGNAFTEYRVGLANIVDKIKGA